MEEGKHFKTFILKLSFFDTLILDFHCGGIFEKMKGAINEKL